MIARLVFGLLVVGLLSCSSRQTRPESILPQEKMESLLWDLLRAEHFAHNYIVTKDTSISARARGPVLYEAILKKHGTTDSLFRESLAYYKNHPKLLFPILDSIGTIPDVAPTPLAGAGVSVAPDTIKKPADSSKPAAAPPVVSPVPKNKPTFAPKPMSY